MTTSSWDAWNYRDSAGMEAHQGNLVGFSVHATDGDIGKVDDATRDVGSSFLVVDTGPWIFGRKVLLPAGTVERVDWEDEKIYVDRTKDQIKDSPELDDADLHDPVYREKTGAYYGDTYDRGV